MTKTTQDISEMHNNTINSNIQNSQEMSQLLLENREYGHNLNLRNYAIDKINGILGFQEQDNTQFDRVLNKKRHRNAPEYRKMKYYVKSIRQYKLERQRRKRIDQLNKEGKTYPQIATELKISERTVARDMKKMACYRLGKFNKAIRQIKQNQIDAFNKETEHLHGIQKFQFLTDLLIKQETLFKIREYNRHMIKIIINMDDLIQGCPSIHFSPQGPWSLTKSIHFMFYVEHGEQTECIGGLTQK